MIAGLRYAAATAIDRLGSRAGHALQRLQDAWADAPTRIVVGAFKLSAKITPCGCNAGGWESCDACSYGPGWPELRRTRADAEAMVREGNRIIAVACEALTDAIPEFGDVLVGDVKPGHVQDARPFAPSTS